MDGEKQGGILMMNYVEINTMHMSKMMAEDAGAPELRSFRHVGVRHENLLSRILSKIEAAITK